jgi:hypothetical protein
MRRVTRRTEASRRHAERVITTQAAARVVDGSFLRAFREGVGRLVLFEDVERPVAMVSTSPAKRESARAIPRPGAYRPGEGGEPRSWLSFDFQDSTICEVPPRRSVATRAGSSALTVVGLVVTPTG